MEVDRAWPLAFGSLTLQIFPLTLVFRLFMDQCRGVARNVTQYEWIKHLKRWKASSSEWFVLRSCGDGTWGCWEWEVGGSSGRSPQVARLRCRRRVRSVRTLRM